MTQDPTDTRADLLSTQEALSTLGPGSQPLLNARQERFAHNRANGQGLATAYRGAGFQPGSTRNAASAGSALERRGGGIIKTRVAYLVGLVAKGSQDRRQEVIDRLVDIGLGDIRDLVQWDEYGNLTVTRSADLTEAQAAMVSELYLEKGKGLKIKTVDRLAALDKLARIFKAYPDQDHGPAVGVTIVVVSPPKLSNDDWLKEYGGLEEVKVIGEGES